MAFRGSVLYHLGEHPSPPPSLLLPFAPLIPTRFYLKLIFTCSGKYEAAIENYSRGIVIRANDDEFVANCCI